MGLDFTALNNIAIQGARRDFTDPLEKKGEQPAEKPEKPATAQNTSPSGGADRVATNRLNREKQERENHRQMFSSYQDNIKRAGTLRSEITKGIQAGAEPLDILLKAVECISLMTGDTVIYSQCQKDIQAVYGWEPKKEERE